MKELFKEIKAIPSSRKDLERFGLGGIIFFGSIFLIALIFAHKIHWNLLIIGSSLYVLGKLVPHLLKIVYFPLVIFGLIMGHIVSTVALTLLFFLCLTPIAVLARITGKKFLDLSFRNPSDSYWNKREKSSDLKTSCETQY